MSASAALSDSPEIGTLVIGPPRQPPVEALLVLFPTLWRSSVQSTNYGPSAVAVLKSTAKTEWKILLASHLSVGAYPVDGILKRNMKKS